LKYLRLELDLGIPATAFDVNVRRLGRLALVREEIVAQAVVSENDRHESPLKEDATMKHIALTEKVADYRCR